MTKIDFSEISGSNTEERELVHADATASELLGAIGGVRIYTLEWKADLNKRGIRLDNDCETLLDEHLVHCEELENLIENAGSNEIEELRAKLKKLLENWHELEERMSNGGQKNTDVEGESHNSPEKRTDPSKTPSLPRKTTKFMQQLEGFSGGIANKLDSKENLNHLLNSKKL